MTNCDRTLRGGLSPDGHDTEKLRCRLLPEVAAESSVSTGNLCGMDVQLSSHDQHAFAAEGTRTARKTLAHVQEFHGRGYGDSVQDEDAADEVLKRIRPTGQLSKQNSEVHSSIHPRRRMRTASMQRVPNRANYFTNVNRSGLTQAALLWPETCHNPSSGIQT